jgi:hypothetical protein
MRLFARLFFRFGEPAHVSFILFSYIRKYQQSIIACETKWEKKADGRCPHLIIKTCFVKVS